MVLILAPFDPLLISNLRAKKMLGIIVVALFSYLYPLTAFSETCSNEYNESSVAHTKNGSKIIISTKQCPDIEKRFITVTAESKSKKQRIIKRLEQRLAVGGAVFKDLENDKVPEIELTSNCGAGPSCERTIFKLAPNEKSIYPYYIGGYYNIQRTAHYLVTGSKSGCCGWEYLAYDIVNKKPLGRAFKYLISPQAQICFPA